MDATAFFGSWGSSPRGRGKRPQQRAELLVFGLIPARAAKTAETSRTTTSRRAHPRAGGENLATFALGLGVGGSSPRGRGKLRPHVRLPGEQGLISARAGKTVRVAYIG